MQLVQNIVGNRGGSPSFTKDGKKKIKEVRECDLADISEFLPLIEALFLVHSDPTYTRK